MRLIAMSLLLVIFVLAVPGCGSKGTIDLKPTNNVPVSKPMPYDPAAELTVVDTALPQWGADRPLDEPVPGLSVISGIQPQRKASAAESLDFNVLPELPMPTGVMGDAAHSTSAIQNIDLSVPFAVSPLAAPMATKVNLPSINGATEFAVYELAHTPPDQLLSINVQGDVVSGPEDDTRGVWVGVSNYSTHRFVIYGPFDLVPPAGHTIELSGNAFKNGDNNAYIMLAVADNNVVDVTNLRVDVEEQGVDLLPQEFHTALTNAGLNQNLLSVAQSTVFGGAEPSPANTWSWGTDYWDMMSMLDTYYDAWATDPTAFPEWAQAKGQALEGVADIQDALLSATDEFPERHRITEAAYSHALNPSNPLANAVADLVTATGGTADLPTYQAALVAMSEVNQQPLAILVYAIIDAHQDRNDALATPFLLDEDNLGIRFDYGYAAGAGGLCGVPTDGIVPQLYYRYDLGGGIVGTFWSDFGYQKMFEGSAKIADALDQLAEYIELQSPVWEDVSLTVDTDWGQLVIAGTGDDVHAAPGDDNGHVFLLDLGGNDTYNCRAGGNAEATNGVAVCVDLSGSDVYNRLDDPTDFDRSGGFSDDDTSQQGAGRWGIGMLVDYDGEDEYHSVRASQGSGTFGVGILADLGTDDDAYDMECLGQGAAMGGVGILLDQGGADGYDAWRNSQGFGGIMGIGYLVDQGTGIDTYLANVSAGAADPIRPEYYVDAYGTNLSGCQGQGLGSRWGWITVTPDTDPINVTAAGGQGVCFDGGGDDTYTCGTFGQGMGFFQGLGALIDMGGDDIYNGHWYSQGATAHAAVGTLWDSAGDDSYSNEVSIGIGGAHDWSTTWFFERQGNDVYNFSGLAGGAGYSNGFAFFIDYLGNDEYNATYSNASFDNLGRGKLQDAERVDQPVYGIFVDVRGVDTYDAGYADMRTGLDEAGEEVIATPPANDTAWVRVGGVYTGGGGFYANGYGSGIDGQ